MTVKNKTTTDSEFKYSRREWLGLLSFVTYERHGHGYAVFALKLKLEHL